MKSFHHCRIAALVAFSLACAAGPSAAAPAEDGLWAGADARIEKHRKADATVMVLAGGKPVPGAEVTIEQTRHAFLFGSNIFCWGTDEDRLRPGMDPKLQAAYRKRFADLLNYATLPFYWARYEPEQGRPRHEYTESAARWCQEQGIITKGHPLAWNDADPGWLPNDPDAVFRLQLGRIDDCVKRFAGLIDRWDVVNEATHFDRDEFAKRAPKITAAWAKAGQLEFTRQCFVAARKANPKATLLVNDYRVDPPYEKVIEGLKDAEGKAIYDAIGIQSHQHAGTWTNARIWEVCERYSRFGVPLHFTETTILSGEQGWPRPAGQWPSTPEGEARQAKEVVRFYTMLFSHPAVEAITWWDLADLHAWQGAPAGLVRKDMTPKPAYEELMKLVKGKWWTRAELKTGEDGAAGLRGFLGDYKVTVRVSGKPAGEKTFTLQKTGENRWVVEL